MSIATSMPRLAQALFTSARLASNEGYQLVARSDRLDAATAREITAWAPSHDSLEPELPKSELPAAESINFHVLDRKIATISLTRLLSGEYSGRGRNIATWLLVVHAANMDQFQWHPLRVLDAAQALGWPPADDALPGKLPTTLPDLDLAPTSQAVNLHAVAVACAAFGPRSIARAMQAVRQAAIGQEPLGLIAGSRRRMVLDALLSLLSPDVRQRLTFTTGLACTARRTFVLHFLARSEATVQAFRRTTKGKVLDLTESKCNPSSFTAASDPTIAALLPLLEAGRWCAVRRLVQSES